MGNVINKLNKKQSIKLDKRSFDWVKVIGRGGFGRVHRVVHKKTKQEYAVKKMSKLK